MSLAKPEFARFIKNFQFRELFNEMGWNNDRVCQPVVVDGRTFHLTGIAEKSGFRILLCTPVEGQRLPDANLRKKIENKVTRLFQEHLILFIDSEKKEQIWQHAQRKSGNPVKISEIHYTVTQDPELLYQRTGGIFFTLDEEEQVTIIDVTGKVAANFQQNNEKVTKKFYEGFKKEHTAFLKFIKGIDDQISLEWYASLMLNRLMFCYFIQKKGFLDNNINYLQDKLALCKTKKGKNKFYSFYRNFLMVLFHDGLGAPEHSAEIAAEIGTIPYLNGGLFSEHELEKNYDAIAIDDEAFARLFDFFDQYNWHLDTRTAATGRDINPDVIGYIFEKYINDRAQMGAYYTKEDITDYISKNTIIPWLFDEVKRHDPPPFKTDGWVWGMVRQSGDSYIYDAVKHGIPEAGGLFDDLPPEILQGFNPELEDKVVDGTGPWLHELRKEWNKPAPSEIALPTEIYREVIERRKRYLEVFDRINNGEIREINDFITLNLNMRQFAQDVIETTEDADFIRHFYRALTRVTILDPTCGSGAFLFAALNILEPLYETCIQRMEDFVDQGGKAKFKFFAETLEQVSAPEHPNLQYFIYKSIILNNLYGVDIMNEAVEIAKLRLFLKLVATVDADYRKPNLGLEPLPDIDFNIRAGNTLIGYATEAQLQDAFIGKLDFDNDAEQIKEKCDVAARAFARYKEIQLGGKTNHDGFKEAKDELNDRLAALTSELDVLLNKQHYPNIKYHRWLATHQPFHWFAEFYEIIHDRGGFDVVIGNPPYVEYSKVKKEYILYGFDVEKAGNLYAFILERCLSLHSDKSYWGMIIPMSSICTERAIKVQSIFNNRRTFISNYSGDRNPAEMFEGVKLRLTIFIATKSKPKQVYTSRYLKWYTAFRPNLMDNLSYLPISSTKENTILKIDNHTLTNIYEKIACKEILLKVVKEDDIGVYYHNAPIHWVRAYNFMPFFKSQRDGEVRGSHYKQISANDKNNTLALIALLNSSLFYYWFIIHSNCRDLSLREIGSFCFSFSEKKLVKDLSVLASSLMDYYKSIAKLITVQYQASGTTQYEQIDSKSAKRFIDNIDILLSQHYGFTHEELDFIINYDIKYRMGKELEE